MKFWIVLFLFANSLNNQSFAEVINEDMHQISNELKNLIPFLVSESEFVNKKNETLINNTLTKLEKIFSNLKSHPQVASPGLAISREMIFEQISETKKVFNGPRKNFARFKLNSALNLCISCHTQLPTGEKLKLFSDLDIEKYNLDDFSKAEFLFTTREFEESLKFYSSYIRNFKKSEREIKNLHEALNRKLSYYTRITSSYEAGITSFTLDLKNDQLPISVREQIVTWNKELSKNKPWGKFDGKTATEKEMKQFLDKQVKPLNQEAPIVSLFSYLEVSDLMISGILYEYLNTNPTSKLIPELLYWLAKFDKRLNFNIFYSLGDLYLKECIEKYPKHPFAKKCYREFEDDLLFSYTGSSGTSLPEDAKSELKRLKKLAGIK